MSSNVTPDQISLAEWERRFKGRIVERCMQPMSPEELEDAKERDPDFEPWTQEQAESVANDEFTAAHIDDLRSGFEDDPEGSAEEAMSYWEPA